MRFFFSLSLSLPEKKLQVKFCRTYCFFFFFSPLHFGVVLKSFVITLLYPQSIFQHLQLSAFKGLGSTLNGGVSRTEE